MKGEQTKGEENKLLVQSVDETLNCSLPRAREE